MRNDQLLQADFFHGHEPASIDRRDFLRLTGMGLFMLFTVGDSTLFPEELLGQQRLPTDFNAFLKIGEDGRVTCYTGKIEMGQGVHASLPQMIAEELDVSLDALDIVMGDTDLCPWDQGTWGSLSTRQFGPALRKAGAEARSVLVEMAAEQLKTPASNLTVENGVVVSKSDKDKRVTYAELTKGKRIERRATGDVAVKSPSEFKIIGKSMKRRDSLDKVTGKARFTADLQLPGMLHARILRPPAHGAKLVNVDVSEARKVEGVQVVQDGDLVAVLHRYPDVAEMALSKVKATFDPSPHETNDQNIFEHLLKSGGEPRVLGSKGDVDEGERGSATIFEQTYYDGYKAHAPMEPHAAIVRIEGGKATVWASTQTPFGTKEQVAQVLGLPSEDVRVITPYLGGGFGGKGQNPQAQEAARLAKLTGKPIQVAWTRAEEFFYDSFRPAAVVKIRSGLTKGADLGFWDYQVYFAGGRGAEHFYAIPHSRTSLYSGTRGVNAHPFATGAWRAPANNTNTFARESQVDIMAAKAGVDPFEFRMKHLATEKMRGVLKAAAEKFGWMPAKGPSGRGFGIACGTDAGTDVATIVEVAVKKETGEVRVKRVVCAQDMGLVVNPRGAKLQMDGCIIMGLGYALKEDLRFSDGKIHDVNFDTYEIPRFSWMPEIETVILDKQHEPPQGGGEPAIITMGGAIANAVFDAVGARVFQMPITPDRVKEALRSSAQ
jgi:nicotinate dehydrogenase subunit B